MPDSIERPPSLLAMPTYLASRVVRHGRARLQRALVEHALIPSESPDWWRSYGVLLALTDFGALSQQQLADRLEADKSRLVHLIDQLEQGGLVTRAPDPIDRRRNRIELTAAGHRLLDQIAPVALDLEAEQLKALTAGERRTLVSLLRRVVESLDQPPPA